MFSGARINETSVKSSGDGACSGRQWGASAAITLGAVLTLFAASGAQAQNCLLPQDSQVRNLPAIASSPASIGSTVASTLTTASTAFLLQSTAFIGSPPNPAPYQQGGGVWVRGVGGEIEVKSTTDTVASQPVPAGATSVVQCTQKVREDFGGVQLGADIARFNINGWNVHWGTTAGYLEARGRLTQGAFGFVDTGAPGFPLAGGGPFNSTVQVPFIGTYAAATYGGFFVDGLLRAEYYQTSLNAPGINLFNQNLDAHGVSFSGSIGYNWQVPNTNWFVEPSAGVIISRLKVDPFNYVTAGTPGNTTFSGTLQVDDIKSDIGRLGLRVGTTVDSGSIIWQPFVAASVWHEFGPSATSSYQTCNATNGTPGCVFVDGVTPVTLSATSSTSTFGTFGQYSLGVSAAVANTGWLGFARVDYRNGSNLEGLSGTGGIRYQFTPEAIAKPRMPTKGPAFPGPLMEVVNWTGFYIGGFGGAALGEADWDYIIGAVSPRVGGYLWGGDIGYNYQAGPWVVGVEGDLAKTNINGGTACGPLLDNFAGVPSPMFQMTCNAWANWIASATARVGYAWERALFYVKGGGAWTQEHFSATCNLGSVIQAANSLSFPVQACANPAGVPSVGLEASSNRTGWKVGYGVEFALTRNWSAKAEYDYVSFGDHTVVASDGSTLNLGMHFSEAKIGVNYRFGGY